MRNLDRVAGIIFVVLSIASLRAFSEAGPPEGVPAKLNICESFQAITACGDWNWNGHNFDSNYKTNIGTGTIQRTGMEITISRVDTKAPFGFKGQQAQYHGTIVGNTARGTVELAYTILVDEGYLQMRGAAGTFVSPSLPAVLGEPDRNGSSPHEIEEVCAAIGRGIG